jgi:hypothetical protein
MPEPAVILQFADGPSILVRAATEADALETAHAEAAGEDLVVAFPDEVRLGWWRAVPCVRPGGAGHVVNDTECGGGYRCHYIRSKPGRGAFRAALIALNYEGEYEDDDPVKGPYLAAVAGMLKVARAFLGTAEAPGA